MGGRGSAGGKSAGNSERAINTNITKRQLKTHVTATLKAAGLRKAETNSTSIRGYRTVSHAGFAWGEEDGGITAPNIVYVGGLRATAEHENAYMNRVEAALSRDFRISREKYSIEILGEYEKKK